MIKKLIGVLIFLAGIAGGLYVGGYLCIWGGIMDMASAVLETSDAFQFAWGFIKFWIGGAVGWIIFWVLSIIAAFFFVD